MAAEDEVLLPPGCRFRVEGLELASEQGTKRVLGGRHSARGLRALAAGGLGVLCGRKAPGGGGVGP